MQNADWRKQAVPRGDDGDDDDNSSADRRRACSVFFFLPTCLFTAPRSSLRQMTFILYPSGHHDQAGVLIAGFNSKARSSCWCWTNAGVIGTTSAAVDPRELLCRPAQARIGGRKDLVQQHHRHCAAFASDGVVFCGVDIEFSISRTFSFNQHWLLLSALSVNGAAWHRRRPRADVYQGRQWPAARIRYFLAFLSPPTWSASFPQTVIPLKRLARGDNGNGAWRAAWRAWLACRRSKT